MSQEEASRFDIFSTPRPDTYPPTSRAFTPPPRSIRDILDVLEQPAALDEELRNRLQVEAEAPLPSVRTDGNLSEFYFRRGQAAYHLGQDQKALEDYRLAYDHMQKAGEERLDILRVLAGMEQGQGSLRRAIALFERCRKIDETAVSHDYWQIYDQRLLPLYLSIGDLASAEQALEKGRVLCSFSGSIKGRRINSWRDKARKEAACAQMEARFAEHHNRFEEAEPHWRLYLERRIAIDEPANAIGARMSLAGNLRKQNRLPEAELEVRRALGEAVGYGGKRTVATANAVRALAQILKEQKRHEEAERLAREAVRILSDLGIPDDSWRMINARMLYGETLLRRNRYRQAREQFDRAGKEAVNETDAYRKPFANPNTILALIRTGAIDEAMDLIPAAYETVVKAYGRENERVARVVGLRAMIHAALHRNQEAMEDFAASIPALKQNDQDFIHKSVLDGYVHFLAGISGTPFEKKAGIEAVAEAFSIAGPLRQGATEAALNEACARLAASSDPALAALSRRDQDFQMQIATLEAAVSDHLGLPPKEHDRAIIEGHLRSLEQLKTGRQSLWRVIAGDFPLYQKLIHPGSVTITAVQKNLRPGEVLILIYPSEEKTFVWAVPPQGSAAFSTIAVGKKRIDAAVREIRLSLDIHPRTIGEIPAFDLAQAHELYRKLLKPVEEVWKGASDLIVVAKGSLGQLPLALLPTEETDPKGFREHRGGHFGGYRNIPWLIRKVSITALPSVASLVSLRTIPPSDPNRKTFAGFGDPFFNPEQYARAMGIEKTGFAQGPKPLELASLETPVAVRGVRISEKGDLDSDRILTSRLESLDRLPDTMQEISEIAGVLGADLKRDVFYGKEASEERVKTMDLSNRKVVAFATHALVPGDLDGLEQPALALSSPLVTGEKEDGLLTMEEILRLKLNADWVVLSACNTGAGGGKGEEAVSGLGGAFFYAGARALLVSMWPVETTSGRRLVTGIFAAQEEDPSLSRAQAVRKSMLEMIDRGNLIDRGTGKIVAAYAHPFFWSPFVVVGDAR
jgi:CHAT domain-containing protein